MAGSNQGYDVLLNLLLVGDQGVGKTSLVWQLRGLAFHPQLTTIGVDFLTRQFRIYNKNVKVHVWDTPGAQRFTSITQKYYSKADAILVVYDVTNLASFRNISERWLPQIDQFCLGSKPVRVILGNKSEFQNRVVVGSAARQFASSLALPYIELSGIDASVEETFAAVIRLLLLRPCLGRLILYFAVALGCDYRLLDALVYHSQLPWR